MKYTACEIGFADCVVYGVSLNLHYGEPAR